MPLSDQERRCIELALPTLEQLYGGVWSIGVELDELHNSEPSPECLTGNGTIDAAIEVKRLTGDSVIQAYRESLRSLKRSLSPSCGGFFILHPAVDFRLPIDGKLRRVLKNEIERVAPSLEPGDSGAINIRRQAYVSMSSATGPGFIYCLHNSSWGEVRSASSKVTGSYLLVDQGMHEHTFLTESGREAFQAAIVEACQRRSAGDDGSLEWNDEWELTRSEPALDDEPYEREGVWIICVTEARAVDSSVTECLELMLIKALAKFHRRWATKHVVIFDREDFFSTADRVQDALSWFPPQELAAIDLILLADQDDVNVVWQRQ